MPINPSKTICKIPLIIDLKKAEDEQRKRFAVLNKSPERVESPQVAKYIYDDNGQIALNPKWPSGK